MIFAGFYLTVNKVGSHVLDFSTDAEGPSSSFCGMDINNHMEGKASPTIGYFEHIIV